VPIMISKPECLGWGMNWQHCHNVIFVGADHSFEAWYQAVRRCHRFGQKHPVKVHLIRTSADGRIALNLERKRQEHEGMVRGLVSASTTIERKRITGGTQALKLPAFLRKEPTCQ
jgi:SNF2 family DNA or RNA helicase